MRFKYSVFKLIDYLEINETSDLSESFAGYLFEVSVLHKD